MGGGKNITCNAIKTPLIITRNILSPQQLYLLPSYLSCSHLLFRSSNSCTTHSCDVTFIQNLQYITDVFKKEMSIWPKISILDMTEPLQNYSIKEQTNNKTFRMLIIWSHCHCRMIKLSLRSQIYVLRQKAVSLAMMLSWNDASFTPHINGKISNKELDIISKILDVIRCVLPNVRGGCFFWSVVILWSIFAQCFIYCTNISTDFNWSWRSAGHIPRQVLCKCLDWCSPVSHLGMDSETELD